MTVGAKSSYKWAVILMLWFVCFFNYADRQAIFSVFPLLKSEFGLSDLELGIIGSSFMWMYAFVGPIAGILGDRWSRKYLVLGGLLFWSIITLLTAVSQSYSHLVIFRALGGAGEALYFPAAMSLISDYHDASTRSRAMAVHQSSVYAGSIAGGTLGGVVAEHEGWRWSFIVFGSLGIVLGLALFRYLREPARGESEPALERHNSSRTIRPGSHWGGVRDIFGNRSVVLHMAVFVGANFVAVVCLVWLPLFLYRKFGMSLSMAGFNGTIYLHGASVLGVISGGALADKLVHYRPSGRIWTQSLGLIGAIPFLYLTGRSLSVPVVVMAMAGFGYFKGLYDANIFASLYDFVPLDRRALTVGVMNSLGWLGAGFAPIAMATASQRFGMSTAIAATALIYPVLAFLLLGGTCCSRR